MKKKQFIVVLFFCSMLLNAQSVFQNLAVKKPKIPSTYFYNYTGAIQQFIVPNRVTAIQVNAIGAVGGTGGGGQIGGAGANITTTINVTPGQVLYIVVGGYPGQSATAKYGFAGNGGLANGGTAYGGAGGGLSGVFTSNSPSSINALVIAGGGGGADDEELAGGGGEAGALGGAATGGGGGGGIGIFVAALAAAVAADVAA